MVDYLRDIIDIEELRELMRFFYEAVGVPVGIMDSDNRWLVQIGWQKICTDFHRAHPLSHKACLQSDEKVQPHLQGDDYLSYECPHGLVEVAFPILLEGKSLGVFFMGQFLHQPADQDFFRRQAIHYGYNLTDYLAALGTVPIVSQERVAYLMRFFKRFLGLIIQIGEENQRRRQAESATREARDELEVKVEERTRELNEALNDVGDLAVQLSAALSQVEKLAVTDSLTETYNRRKFDEAVLQEHQLAQAGQRLFSVIMFDVDFFKQVNDNFSHSVGDQVLQHLCRVVRGLVRHADLLIRWGGEEFLILLPATFLNEAALLAERIRIEVEQELFADAGHITISLGVAQFRAGDSIDSLLKRVDAALHLAKQQGRNRVIVDERTALVATPASPDCQSE
ncbi:MAG TPA: diguanylate cyclase [Malonomonas sp.]